MTHQSTIYKFAYYYTSGDGSNDSEPYTNKEEAIKDFKLMVEEEIKDEWTQEDEVIDYAILWSCKDAEDPGEDVNHLYWTFELGYTDYDPPVMD